MIKFKDIYSEIKVVNPTKQFRVTPKGKQACKDTHDLLNLASKYGLGDLVTDSGMEEDKFRIANVFRIYTDEWGEGLIKIDEENSLEEYIQKYKDIWDPDDGDAKNKLKEFIKEEYITPINL